MVETTPAVQLRSQVVLIVVSAIAGLAVGLYALCGLLVVFDKPVPGELWLAAGNASGALISLLVNSKHDTPAAVEVVNDPADPVPVDDAGEGELRLIAIYAIATVIGLVLFKVLIEPHLR